MEKAPAFAGMRKGWATKSHIGTVSDEAWRRAASSITVCTRAKANVVIGT